MLTPSTCPARVSVVGGVLRETPRLGIRAFEIQQPQIAATAIGFEIGLALHVHHVAPVRRNLRIADARQHVEVGRSEGARGAFGARRGDAESARKCYGDAQPGFHDDLQFMYAIRSSRPISDASMIQLSAAAAASQSRMGASSSTVAMYAAVDSRTCAP